MTRRPPSGPSATPAPRRLQLRLLLGWAPAHSALVSLSCSPGRVRRSRFSLSPPPCPHRSAPTHASPFTAAPPFDFRRPCTALWGTGPVPSPRSARVNCITSFRVAAAGNFVQVVAARSRWVLQAPPHLTTRAAGSKSRCRAARPAAAARPSATAPRPAPPGGAAAWPC